MFLNAALAKARWLNLLKDLSETKKKARGADAVLEAVQSSQQPKPDEATSSGTVAFSLDETRESTRALRARAEQAGREQAKKAIKKEDEAEEKASKMDIDRPTMSTVKEEEPEEEANLSELAKEVKEEEDNVALEGATGTTVAMGRGLGGVLSMLRQQEKCLAETLERKRCVAVQKTSAEVMKRSRRQKKTRSSGGSWSIAISSAVC